MNVISFRFELSLERCFKSNKPRCGCRQQRTSKPERPWDGVQQPGIGLGGVIKHTAFARVPRTCPGWNPVGLPMGLSYGAAVKARPNELLQLSPSPWRSLPRFTYEKTNPLRDKLTVASHLQTASHTLKPLAIAIQAGFSELMRGSGFTHYAGWLSFAIEGFWLPCWSPCSSPTHGLTETEPFNSVCTTHCTPVHRVRVLLNPNLPRLADSCSSTYYAFKILFLFTDYRFGSLRLVRESYPVPSAGCTSGLPFPCTLRASPVRVVWKFRANSENLHQYRLRAVRGRFIRLGLPSGCIHACKLVSPIFEQFSFRNNHMYKRTHWYKHGHTDAEQRSTLVCTYVYVEKV